MRHIDKKLFICVRADNLKKAEECVANGANVDAVVDRRKNTMLMFVKSREMTAFLLHNGANPNARNINGDVPHFNASNPGVLQELFENGANIHLKNNLGDDVLINFSKRVNGGRPELSEEAFIEMWKVLRAFGVNTLGTNYEGKSAKDYLDQSKWRQAHIINKIKNAERNQRIKDGARIRALSERSGKN